jgi:hypothetical protein
MVHFHNRKEVWLIFFHRGPDDYESKKFKNTYVTLAEKLYGSVRVGAIDCSREQELCKKQFLVDDPFLIVGYTESSQDRGDYFTGKTNEWKPLADFAVRKM